MLWSIIGRLMDRRHVQHLLEEPLEKLLVLVPGSDEGVPRAKHVGQNYGPLLVPLNISCRIILRTQKCNLCQYLRAASVASDRAKVDSTQSKCSETGPPSPPTGHFGELSARHP